MPIAPLVAAVRRRLANVAGPVRASGEASNGEPVQVELLVAGEWVDITSYCLVRDNSGNIRITYGVQGGEGSQTDRATAALQLRNDDGRFSPRNPSGPYFGLIGRNTPLRISVPDGNGGKSYRLWGEVAEWAPNWDPSGNDVWVDVTVVGILQRLAQAPAPERSVIYSAITDPLPTTVVAYWPCEDASGATSLGSALTSGSPMTWTGTPSLAAYSGFAASDPLPDLTLGSLSGGVARYDDPTATQVRFLAYIPADGLSDGKVLCAIDQVDTGGAQFWELYYSTTSRSLTLRQHNLDGSMLGATLEHTLDVRGRLLYVSVELQESGTSCDRAIRLTDVATRTVYSVTDTAASTSLTRVTKVQFGPASRSVVGPVGSQYLPGVAVGHVTVENTITATDALGVRLNPVGETAGRRIQRLCGEEGIAVDWVGDLDDTVPLGAQGRSNTLSLLQEATLADGGLLYENRQVLGLGYRTRTSLYNQDAALTLSYTGYQLAQVPVPVEDDRTTQNKVTVTVGGVSATYEETDGALSTQLPPAGVGVYGSDVTLNLADSARETLLDQAAWRVHLGTVDEARYPRIAVNLAHSSITPDMRRAILALRLGDRVQITSPPAWLPPDTIDQIILGIEPETITHFEHWITFLCAPASPYSSIGVLDATACLIDTDGSELLTAVDSSATSLVVVPSAGETGLWTTASSAYPVDIRVGGEVMRVTAVSPWLSDTFTRTTSNGWGTADTGQAWATAGGSAAEYSTTGTQGVHAVGSVNASRYTVVESTSPDVELRMSVATSALATGGPQYTHLVARLADVNNLYAARLAFASDQSVTLALQRRVAGVQTDLASITLSGTHAAATSWNLRFEVRGATLRAKGWPAAETEPGWQLSTTDTSHTTAGYVGVRSVLDASNTNVLPVSFTYDDVQLVNPQTFTVTRSINGVTKSHSAGADVRLATPTILAL